MPTSHTIPLPRRCAPVIGVGAFLKSTLCLIQGDQAFVTHDFGSLDSAAAVENFEREAKKLMANAKERPLAIAHDLHPDFPSTRFARQSGLTAIGIQHHHAHIAAVMAEHGLDQPVLGLALDGFGLGLNDEAWGGELLHVDSKGFRRLGHLRPLPQPGGDIAARQPWRMGAAALHALGRRDEIATRYAAFPQAAALATMLERNLNCPPTSSAGRLFDAACGLLNVKPVAEFEGEAPMALEALVKQTTVDSAGWKITQENNSSNLEPRTLSLILDMRPLLKRLIGMEPQEGADLFHGTLTAALADWAEKAAQATGISTVILSGGCFLNKVLREELCQRMMAQRLTPLLPKKMPVGDAAVSLGQAWAATLQLESK